MTTCPQLEQVEICKQPNKHFHTSKYVYILGIIAIIILSVGVLVSSVPSSTVTNSVSTQSYFTFIRNILPQGWAFFTRDPRSPGVSVYQHDSISWTRISSASNSSPHEIFGANRKARTEQYEIEALVQNSKSTQWTACEAGDLLYCLHVPHSSVQTVKTISQDPRYCGAVALVREDPIPWAWAQTTYQMSAEIKFLNVICEISKRGN